VLSGSPAFSPSVYEKSKGISCIRIYFLGSSHVVDVPFSILVSPGFLAASQKTTASISDDLQGSRRVCLSLWLKIKGFKWQCTDLCLFVDQY